MKRFNVSTLYKMGSLIIVLGALLLSTSVVVAKDKDAPLAIDDNYVTIDLSCPARHADSCESELNPDPDVEKAIHTVTLSAVVVSGTPTCSASASIHNEIFAGVSNQTLIQLFASQGVPTALSLTLARPIILEDRDKVQVSGNLQNSSPGDECQVHAVFGIERL